MRLKRILARSEALVLGQRQFPTKYGNLKLQEGSFAKDIRGQWWARPPGHISAKIRFSVAEHADDTITILGVFCGFTLKRGVWKEVQCTN